MEWTQCGVISLKQVWSKDWRLGKCRRAWGVSPHSKYCMQSFRTPELACSYSRQPSPWMHLLCSTPTIDTRARGWIVLQDNKYPSSAYYSIALNSLQQSGSFRLKGVDFKDGQRSRWHSLHSFLLLPTIADPVGHFRFQHSQQAVLFYLENKELQIERWELSRTRQTVEEHIEEDHCWQQPNPTHRRSSDFMQKQAPDKRAALQHHGHGRSQWDPILR